MSTSAAPVPSTAPLASWHGGELRLAGAFTLPHGQAVQQSLGQALATAPAKAQAIDLSQVTHLDGAGVVLLLQAQAALVSDDQTPPALIGGSPAAKRLFELYRGRRSDHAPAPPTTTGIFTAIGAMARAIVADARSGLAFLGALCRALVQAGRRPGSVAWRTLPLLVQRAGAEGALIVVMTNLLIGAIMAFQGALQLERFGAMTMTPMMVTIAHLRELGPIMTAFIVAGRSGAGFAAELGTMKVSEEIDALQTMGIDPFRWLVLPRLLALLIVLPLLTILGNGVGLCGGMIATLGMVEEMSFRSYWQAVGTSLEFRHFASGILKTLFFAVAIAAVACGQGLAAKGGAAAVGVRTTAAVVVALFAVVVLDCLFAVLFAVVGF